MVIAKVKVANDKKITTIKKDYFQKSLVMLIVKSTQRTILTFIMSYFEFFCENKRPRNLKIRSIYSNF